MESAKAPKIKAFIFIVLSAEMCPFNKGMWIVRVGSRSRKVDEKRTVHVAHNESPDFEAPAAGKTKIEVSLNMSRRRWLEQLPLHDDP